MLLREYVGDMTRSLTLVHQLMEDEFGHMYRVGGNTVYAIGDQQLAIYTFGGDSAMGLAWKTNEIVDSIYWWDDFSPYKEPDYELVLPSGIDIENILPQIKSSIQNKTMGEITI